MNNYFKNKKILILGHNGFKGSWLSLTLIKLEAKVYGISLKNKEKNNFYFQNQLYRHVKEKNFDITDYNKLKKTVLSIKPDIIFHLAAQSLVKRSFEDPLKTWKTNLIGTLNLLNSIRYLQNKCSAIIITSDKCYLNKEINRGYFEYDELGGLDPYGASKGAAEIGFRSYYHSFFKDKKNVRIASARAGNVLGGGDWNKDRIIPDCMRSWFKNSKISIRNPHSTRPWQHVLDIINGYLSLAYNLNKNKKLNGESFNFGPKSISENSVLKVVLELKKTIKNFKFKIYKKLKFKKKIKEAKLLSLNSQKSFKLLNWKPIINFSETIKITSEWYLHLKSKKNISIISNYQINKFLKNLKKNKKSWINF